MVLETDRKSIPTSKQTVRKWKVLKNWNLTSSLWFQNPKQLQWATN